MFIVRVDRRDESRTVFECQRYTVRHAAGDSRLEFGDREPVVIGAGDIAFVMNERGDTIDVIRPGGARAHRRTR